MIVFPLWLKNAPSLLKSPISSMPGHYTHVESFDHIILGSSVLFNKGMHVKKETSATLCRTDITTINFLLYICDSISVSCFLG